MSSLLCHTAVFLNFLRLLRRCLAKWFSVGVAFVACFASSAAAPRTPVTALAFSPDGSALFVSGYKSVLIQSTKDGTTQRTLNCDLAKITALTLSPDGRILAVSGGTPGESGAAHLFDWKQRKIMNKLEGDDDLVTSVAFNSDGTQFVVASADATVKIFRIEEGGRETTLAFTLTDHAGPVLAVAFSPDGKTIVTASVDRSLKVWDASTGKLLRTFSNHTAIVHCVTFRPSGKMPTETIPAFCASGSDDKTVRVWQPEIGRMVRIVRQHEGAVLALAYSRDGIRLFSAGTEGIVRVIDAEGDAIRHQWKAHDDWIHSLAMSSEGTKLATGDWAGRVKLWDISDEIPRLLW